MANLVATDDILEATLLCHARSQQSYNVRHYQVGSVLGDGVTDVQIATALEDAFAPLYKELMSANANWDGVKLQIISPTKRPAVGMNAAAGVGSFAGDNLSTQTAGVIALRTNLTGRSHRGRVYIPFPPEGRNDATAKPSAGYVGDLGVLASQFVSPLTVVDGGNSATIHPILFSRKLNAAFLLVDAVARLEWGTNRRRSHINRADIIFNPA